MPEVAEFTPTSTPDSTRLSLPFEMPRIPGRGVDPSLPAEIRVISPNVLPFDPPRPPSTIDMSDKIKPKEDITTRAKDLFRKRSDILGLQLDEESIYSNSEKLVQLSNVIGPRGTAALVNHPYSRESLELLLDLDPQKIKLALIVSEKVSEICKTFGYDKQYLPTLNLVGFIVAERLHHLPSFGHGSTEDLMNELAKAPSTNKWADRYLNRRLSGWIKKQQPILTGDALATAVMQTAVNETHSKLKAASSLTQKLGQSQGIEIEVLKRITKSKSAATSGVDQSKWLPRGIRSDMHSRTDWRLLPLLGIDEDIGERKFQTYEMATDPSETAITQVTTVLNLIAGGFITEDELSGINPLREGREGYSLHVSSVFPQETVTPTSLREYRSMARTLAGAYSTDQRLAFGGFMSGGAEIADKSSSGRLKSVGDNGNSLENQTLIEVRNLDISAIDQFPAMMQKEILDFAFKCSWEKNANPNREFNPLEIIAAKQWRAFQSETQALLSKYGLSNKQLFALYGPGWEDMAWKAFADAREKHPGLKAELKSLIRRSTRRITQDLINPPPKEEATLPPVGLYNVTSEPFDVGTNNIFLNLAQRKGLGVEVGDNIVLAHGDKMANATVKKAFLRGDRTVEDGTRLRLSKDVLGQLEIPESFPITIDNASNNVLNFSEFRNEEDSVTRIRTPKMVESSPESTDSLIYLTPDEQLNLGVLNGESLYLAFGSQGITASVATGSPDNKGSWLISKSISTSLKIPDGISVRGRYDKTTGELRFGPSMAYLQRVTDFSDGKLSLQGQTTFFDQAESAAKNYGAFLCVVDPHNQPMDLVKSGFVEAYYKMQDGTWVKSTIPVPDVEFDKDVSYKGAQARKVVRAFKEHVSPPEERGITTDKFGFHEALVSGELKDMLPDTVLIKSRSDISNLLSNHERVIFKPRYGMQGRGAISVGRDKEGQVSIKYNEGSTESSEGTLVEKLVPSTEAISILEGLTKGREYIGQEKVDFAQLKFDYEGLRRVRNIEIRVNLQRGINGEPTISGMVTRLMNKDIPSRTSIKRPPHLVLNEAFGDTGNQILESVRRTSKLTMSQLELAMGKKTGEVTVDIGVKPDGSLMIIEANSKGMTRAMFREIGDKAAVAAAVRNPTEYALYLTDFA